jgi:hypothetical protein
MTGRTNYTGVSNGDVPDFGTDITDVYEHFDPLVGESAATVGALPSTGNWTGRTVWVVAESAHYVWTGSTWDDQGAPESTSTLHSGLAVSGYSVTGDIETETVGAKKKVTLSLIINRTGAGVSVPSGSYLTIGTVLPSAARFAAGNRYQMVSIWTDGGWTTGVVYMEMNTGVISLRAIPSTVTMGTSGFVELNCVLYGTS